MNTLNKTLTWMALCLPLLTWAQPGGDRVESMRIAYISNRLQLTPEEAKVFWPVYNKLQDEMKELRKKYKMREEDADLANMTDQEAEKELNDLLALREAQLNLARKYQAELKKVIPARKVLLLYRAEEDFKKELLKRMRERRMGGQHIPPQER